MIELNTPGKIKTSVPENETEDDVAKYDFNEESQLKNGIKFYNENGYVVFKDVFSKDVCQSLRKLWEDEIKPFKGKIYRQTTAKAEKNEFNKNNWIMNPIVNLQSLNPSFFSGLRNYSEEKIFSSNNLCKILNSFFDERPKFVQSMYFEGNSATWEHQDTYYLDSVVIGSMIAGWIALEDIKADAGRFFVCPLSNKEKLIKQTKENNYGTNHKRYIEQIISLIEEKQLKIKAPYLKTGDLLLWNSKTIHGSLDSRSDIHSRSSITFHAIPESHKFLQFQSIIKNIKTSDLGKSLIYRHKDQSKVLNRLIFNFESKFPKIFYFIKNNLIKLITK
tara:strand:+ start:708 stop:1706 length:999 start_codon:yes stop_codon:yes gene_type:complete